MSKHDLTLAAGQTVEFYEPGDFFRLLKAVDPVKIEFYRNGAEISEAPGVTTGYAEKMRLGEFDRIRVYSATAQTVSLVTRMGADVYFDAPPTGAVTVSNAVTVANPVSTVTVANPVTSVAVNNAVTIANPVTSVAVNNPVTIANPVSTVTVANPVTSVAVNNPVTIANPVSTVTVANPVTSVAVNNAVTIANPVSTVTVANPVSTVTVANPVTSVTVANPVTSVAVSNVNSAFGQINAGINNSGSVVMLAAKANRRYLLIQNNDPIGDIYVNLSGSAATATTGILIKAGESFELNGFCTTAAIQAIGTIASNSKVIVVEG